MGVFAEENALNRATSGFGSGRADTSGRSPDKSDRWARLRAEGFPGALRRGLAV